MNLTRKALRFSIIAASACGAVLLVILSPLLIGWLPDRVGDSAKLAEIGEAYGPVSAVVSSLALAGISVSLIIQRRQSRVAEIQMERQRHFDLVKMAIDDPQLAQSIGANPEDPYIREKLLVNLYIGHFLTMWRLGRRTDDSVRHYARRLFHYSPVAREFWAAEQHEYVYGDLPSDQRFVDLVTAEWRAATDEIDRAVEIAE